MNEVMFRKWLIDSGYSCKVAGDTISRLKKIEHSTNCDIDAEYRKDLFSFLLSLFENKGENDRMAALIDNELPVGKYYLSTYKYALTLYSKYKNEEQNG